MVHNRVVSIRAFVFSGHLSGKLKSKQWNGRVMKGLKKYTHEDRQKVIDEMVPLIKKKFAENLVALAAQASFARNEDFGYSDLELIAFVNEMPEGKKWDGMGKIRDGLLVELVWMTKERFIEGIEVNKDWFISGSDVLVPIINEEFIKELNEYKVENLRQKCLAQAAKRWNQYQESVAKVLNAITKENRDGIPLMAMYMFHDVLVMMSFLNQVPYVTLARFESQAREFQYKPRGFDELVDLMANGDYQDLPRLERVTTDIFSELEEKLEELGFDLYYGDVDPNKPMKKYELE
jgi:hypothetical protein